MDAPEPDPNRPDGGFADLLGYRLDRWEPGLAEVSIVFERKHVNRSGRLHGGVLVSIIDAACGLAGCNDATPGKRRALTLTLNTQFLGSAELGERIRCLARLTGGGGTVFFAAAEVVGAQGQPIARGDGVFKYRRDSA